jgi:putative MATE family efflux protein
LKFFQKNREILEVASLGVPIVVNHASFSLMQFTDAWIAGKLGSAALAAIMPASAMISLLSIFGIEALTTVSTQVSQHVGKGRRKACGGVTWQGIYCGLCFGWACLIYFPTAELIFRTLFGNQASTSAQLNALVKLEVDYFQVSLLSLAPLMVNTAVGNFLTGLGQSLSMMMAALLGVAANTILSYCLAFGWGGIPALGFVGIAWGTLFATLLQMLVLILLFLGPKRMRHEFRTSCAGFGTKRAFRLVKNGIAAGMHGCVDYLAWGVVLTWLISFSGESHLAAQAIMVRCITLSFLPAEGMSLALATLVGTSVGQRDYLQARRYARAGFILNAAWMSLMALIYLFFGHSIIQLFTGDPAIIEAASAAIQWVAAFQFFDALNVTYSNALQGAGDISWPSAINLTISLVVLLGGGLSVVTFLPGSASSGVWAVATLYVVAHGVIYFLRWHGREWQNKRFLA